MSNNVRLSGNVVEDKARYEYSNPTPRLLMQGTASDAPKNSKFPVETVATARLTVTFINEPENLARATALASESTLRKLWDTPEEDEAWQNL